MLKTQPQDRKTRRQDGEPLIRLDGIHKVFRNKEIETHAVAGVDLAVYPGEYIVLSGPSGCGKSTLLSILGLLDEADKGGYRLKGSETKSLSGIEKADLRNREIGFVFQNYNLIDDMTVLENVALPLFYAGVGKADREAEADALLERMGLGRLRGQIPSRLSGGQQQRVAVARALVGKPSLLLADEPTGNLDSGNGEKIMDLLGEINQQGTTLFLVTHDPRFVGGADRHLAMLDGKIVSDAPGEARRV